MKIHFTASPSEIAQQAFNKLTQLYKQYSPEESDCIVSIGGDGHVLASMYESLKFNKPVFGLRRTESVGFLCNSYDITKELETRVSNAVTLTIHPLRLEAETMDGNTVSSLSINEISILRQTPQAAKLRIFIDNKERLERLVGDGILVATPTGSTAYNRSCGGPIMPVNANTLVITGISVSNPRGWSYAVLPQSSVIEIEVLEIHKRFIKIESAGTIIRNAKKARIFMDKTKELKLLFDPDERLDERIIKEQFML